MLVTEAYSMWQVSQCLHVRILPLSHWSTGDMSVRMSVFHLVSLLLFACMFLGLSVCLSKPPLCARLSSPFFVAMNMSVSLSVS